MSRIADILIESGEIGSLEILEGEGFGFCEVSDERVEPPDVAEVWDRGEGENVPDAIFPEWFPEFIGDDYSFPIIVIHWS